MKHVNVLRDFGALPNQAQQEVIDFIAFLKTRYANKKSAKIAKKLKLSEELFVGIWKNHNDIEDSTQWVRDLREKEWDK